MKVALNFKTNALKCVIIFSDQFCTLAVPRESGGYMVGVGQSIVHFDWDTDQVTTMATVDQGKNTRLNDGKADASGRLWFGECGSTKFDRS